MTTIEILRNARGLIDTPVKWSPFGWGNGRSMCAINAISSAMGHPDLNMSNTPAYQALRRVVNVYVGEFNDTHSHAEVLAAFDRAIEVEEAKAAEFTASPVTELTEVPA